MRLWSGHTSLWSGTEHSSSGFRAASTVTPIYDWFMARGLIALQACTAFFPIRKDGDSEARHRLRQPEHHVDHIFFT